ncbi:MAG: uracil phosphoribosyltransferase [Phycisphaerales bacterium]|nr:uracil phosphoribosyltransferase [Phycisphaerales bacterium]
MPKPHAEHPNLHVFDHPLIQHKLSYVRDRDTSFRAFRALVNQIAGLMVFEVTRTFPHEEVHIETPLEATTGTRIRGKITICPILRAGLGMSMGVSEIMPEARIGHIGLFRDEETLRPVEYLNKLPADLNAGPVILIDPMLATGGSASAAVNMIKQRGAEDIRMICLVAAPEGVSRMAREHPGMPVYAAALDRCLDDRGYIRPGLGDAGDRLFGTDS